jgi:hypothetical protein
MHIIRLDVDYAQHMFLTTPLTKLIDTRVKKNSLGARRISASNERVPRFHGDVARRHGCSRQETLVWVHTPSGHESLRVRLEKDFGRLGKNFGRLKHCG